MSSITRILFLKAFHLSLQMRDVDVDVLVKNNASHIRGFYLFANCKTIQNNSCYFMTLSSKIFKDYKITKMFSSIAFLLST